MERLAAEFPQLQDEGIANDMLSAARTLADHYGHPELANNVEFMRSTFLAYLGAEAIQREQEEMADEPPGSAYLEGGAGSGPGGRRADGGDVIVSPQLAGAPLGSKALLRPDHPLQATEGARIVSDHYSQGDDGGQAYAEQAGPDPYEAARQAYIEQGATELVADHPELAQEQHATDLVGRARGIAEINGSPHLAEDPAFLRFIHENHLTPGDTREMAERIIDPTPGLGRHVLPFGG
jgi:hypothetical protein